MLSLERDRRALGHASAHLKAMSDFGIGAEGAAEAAKLRDSEGELETVSMIFSSSLFVTNYISNNFNHFCSLC